MSGFQGVVVSQDILSQPIVKTASGSFDIDTGATYDVYLVLDATSYSSSVSFTVEGSDSIYITGGGIAGIVIGCIVVIGSIVGFFVCCCCGLMCFAKAVGNEMGGSNGVVYS